MKLAASPKPTLVLLIAALIMLKCRVVQRVKRLCTLLHLPHRLRRSRQK
jgi:hypothetical protein